MNDDFRLVMISAMYENGGNTTHRFLDGHPQMYVYPFESQVGTRHVQDFLTSLFPVKYRWPAFLLDATPDQDYRAIIDEECKVRARTPQSSKFRHVEFDFSDDERLNAYRAYITRSGRSRSNNVAALFRATFDVWKNYRRTGQESVYVGYSPVIVVDADKILTDLPAAHVVHVVRNPWSSYADTKKRAVPHSLEHYFLGWNLNQYYALLGRERFPDRLHILRTEDVIADPVDALGAVCEKLGLERAAALRHPSWNGTLLDEVYPWGTIRKATPRANRETAEELSAEEREEVRQYTWQYLETFDYKSFV
jgi:hypothetical protein